MSVDWRHPSFFLIYLGFYRGLTFAFFYPRDHFWNAHIELTYETIRQKHKHVSCEPNEFLQADRPTFL